MKTALFTNFTDQDFTGYWDGKGKKFVPGQSLYMPDYLARHFAKHLTNQELLREKTDGSLVYEGGDKMTSPKRPEDVPLFVELFNKAYTSGKDEELGDQEEDIDSIIGSINKNKEKRGNKTAELEATDISKPKVQAGKQDPTKPQVVLPPDFNDKNEDDDEGSFDGQPVETAPDA